MCMNNPLPQGSQIIMVMTHFCIMNITLWHIRCLAKHLVILYSYHGNTIYYMYS